MNKLLEELIEYTAFKTDKMALQVIAVIDCEGYRDSVEIADPLLRELLDLSQSRIPPVL